MVKPRPPFYTSLTPLTLTRFLAYVHHYTPDVLPGRSFSPTHLRRLSQWIESPQPALRSLRTNRAAAAHLALLQGAGLLATADKRWFVTPSATTWLHATTEQQLAPLLDLLDCPTQWSKTIESLGLDKTFSDAHLTWLHQLLRRQATNMPSSTTLDPSPTAPAYWHQHTSETEWKLCLPPALPCWLLFDLLQLGEWQPGEPLRCTPLTVITAQRRGYGGYHIRWLLETATQQPLPNQHAAELEKWLRQGQAYRLREVRLLSTAQPEQLQEILVQKRWRPFFREQITPRHAIISSELIPHLQRWLVKKGYALNSPTANPKPTKPTFATTTAYHWLGLRLLLGLGEILPLPYPPPHVQLDSLDAELTPLERGELEGVAQNMLDQLREAIRGRDAFWPLSPQHPIPEEWLTCIQQAIEAQRPLEILYQTPAEIRPGYRQVQPLRLYQRGALHYVHAYCYRAEMNLDFRVDRIVEMKG